jgi:hypothetical protein
MNVDCGAPCMRADADADAAAAARFFFPHAWLILEYLQVRLDFGRRRCLKAGVASTWPARLRRHRCMCVA